MDDQQCIQGTTAVQPSQYLGPNRWEKTLEPGKSTVTRHRGGTDVAAEEQQTLGIPSLQRVKISADIQNVDAARVPETLAFGPRVTTQCDVISLSDAQPRLRCYSEHLSKLISGMASINTLVYGAQQATKPSIGTSPIAKQLRSKHEAIEHGAQTLLTTASDQLGTAEGVLGQVAENYRVVEDQNRMTAEQLEGMLTQRSLDRSLWAQADPIGRIQR